MLEFGTDNWALAITRLLWPTFEDRDWESLSLRLLLSPMETLHSYSRDILFIGNSDPPPPTKNPCHRERKVANWAPDVSVANWAKFATEYWAPENVGPQKMRG